MIDLRSDTVTLPTREMLETIFTAKLGDDARRQWDGGGGDETVRELERYAAELTGKEDAAFLPTGILANTTAIYTFCRPGDRVAVDPMLHIYKAEQTTFQQRYGRLEPVFYRLTEKGLPDLNDLEEVLQRTQPTLVCIENTHNFGGGICMTPEHTQKIKELAEGVGASLFLDGARLFNAAVTLGVDVKELCAPVDALMFCVSKGLGAPMGSLLCGTADWVREARGVQKSLGGGMRQAGVLGAPALYALQHNRERLAEDHANAKLFAKVLLETTNAITLAAPVESNIVLMDISGTGQPLPEFIAEMEQAGVRSHIAPGTIRITFHLGVDDTDARQAAQIIGTLANRYVK